MVGSRVQPRIVLMTLTALVLAGVSAPRAVYGFAYVLAGENLGVNIVTHPIGYTGSGGTLNISVGIDPTSANAASMVNSTQNVINTWNALVPTTGNLNFGTISGSQVDFESVLLHEMGHSLGLAHVNLASESGISGPDQNYTKSTDGANNTFDLNAGTDGVRGSRDDLRGDDVNLNYFRISNNNPFTIAGTVDSTTYSRDTSNLPGGHNYSENADRNVSALPGRDGDTLANTEAVLQQGTFFGEAQRTLGHDDVAGIRYAMSGIDELAGTGDDYTINLTYAGLTTIADIVIDFDNSQTGFAVSSSSLSSLGSDHWRIVSNNIYFNTGFNWFFNPVPEPSSFALACVALLAGAGYGWRRLRRTAE